MDWTERKEMYACWLCNYPGASNRRLHQLVKLCGDPEKVYFADLGVWGKVLSSAQTEGLKAHTAVWRPEEEYFKMRREGIRIVTMDDRNYPSRLKDIPDPPYGLFYRGRLPKEETPAVAVVGARECSEYGKYVANRLGAVLGANGITLISGMARGIDGICQRAALKAGGYSAGVLGSGVDVCYPEQNRELYEKLSQTGAVISSYPLGTPALGRNFPPRNRIVSGFADAVVVIEARIKSGTLITVDMALEQGREVYVVPGRVTDTLSQGCNSLIRQGAGILLDPEEFLEEIRKIYNRDRAVEKDSVSGGNISNASNKLSDELAAVYEVLDFTPKSTEEIQAGMSRRYEQKDIISHLMELAMEGIAVQVSPGRFCKNGD